MCLASRDTLSELHEVVTRPGWEPYTVLAGRLAFARRVDELSETTQVETVLAVCRDPKDDKFLALAIDGQADFLVTGDKDLLALAQQPDPTWKFKIVAPEDFLEAVGGR